MVKKPNTNSQQNIVGWDNINWQKVERYLFKQQKRIYAASRRGFREGDILEEDHILATALGGKHEYGNLQLLHGICHDVKTAKDLVEIRKKDSIKFYEKLSREWSKVNFKWIDDIPVVLDC